MSNAQAQAVPIESPASSEKLRPAEQSDALARLRLTYPEDYRAVASYILRRTGDHDLAGELASETYAHALASIARWSDRDIPIRAWLLGIATRRLAHHNRRLARRSRSFALLRAGSAPRAPADPLTQDEASRLRDAIATLPHPAQDVLYLHHVETLPLREISFILEVPEGTLKSRLSRAREQLARALDPASPTTEHRHAH